VRRLRVDLPGNWLDISATNPGGAPTYCRREGGGRGALQISLQAEWKGGSLPDPTPDRLLELAERIALHQSACSIEAQSTGTCAIGSFGSVVARTPECAHMQVWVLSDGRDFVLATHVAMESPPEAEVAEAARIVMGVQLLQE
jgi:hypothetical protein